MTDEQRYKLLTEFANSLSVVKGGNIKVTVTAHCNHFEPREMPEGMKFEDCEYLYDVLHGATNFLYFLDREGYTLTKTRYKSVMEMVENISKNPKFVEKLRKKINAKNRKENRNRSKQ